MVKMGAFKRYVSRGRGEMVFKKQTKTNREKGASLSVRSFSEKIG